MPRKNLFRVMSSSGDILRCLNAKNASIHKVFLLNLITFTVRIFLYFLFQSQYKKYTTGHKVVWAPYSKAVESLKKFRKKSRNKPMFEDQKEAQVVHISFFISKILLVCRFDIIHCNQQIFSEHFRGGFNSLQCV